MPSKYFRQDTLLFKVYLNYGVKHMTQENLLWYLLRKSCGKLRGLVLSLACRIHWIIPHSAKFQELVCKLSKDRSTVLFVATLHFELIRFVSQMVDAISFLLEVWVRGLFSEPLHTKRGLLLFLHMGGNLRINVPNEHWLIFISL